MLTGRAVRAMLPDSSQPHAMSNISLPDSLKQQIASYESRLKRMETLLALAGALAGFLLMYVFLFVLDRFFDTPQVLRAVLLASGTIAAAVFAQRWGRDWLWKRRSANQLAVLLGKHFRSLGDRLQGVLELAEAGELPPNISPALCRAAIAQVAAESKDYDFPAAVPVKHTKRWMAAAAVVLALTVTPFVLVPKAANNAAQRFLAPLSDIQRYTFASLNELPKELFVAHGEPFSLDIGLTEDSAWKPSDATATISTQEPIQVSLENHRATLPLPPQTRDVTLKLRVGDASREIAIHPLHRPELKQLTAQVQPPAYLQLPGTSKKVQGATAEFLVGSEVKLEGKIARPLSTASMEGESAAPTIAADTFVTAGRVMGEEPAVATLSWADEHQLKPAQPYTLKMLPVKDAEPKIDIKDLEPEVAILTSELIKLNFIAADDFGIKETWIGWTVSSTGPDKKVISKGETVHQPGSPTSTSISGVIDWSPMWHKIPEDTQVELAAYTTDYFPDRKPSVSWKHTIWVLSPAKHAEKVRDRMDAVLKQLDDRIRDEERQLEEAKAIAERKDDLNSEKTTEEIKRLEAGERQNDEQLQKLTAEMENVMKEALRNKEIPEATLSDWDKLTQKLQADANPELAKAAEKMEKAANAKPSEGKPSKGKPKDGKPSDGKPPEGQPGEPPPEGEEEEREQELAKAQESQEKALESMREAAKKMNTANENLYARNFYNRLRHAAQQEQTVSSDLKKLAKTTVGLTPSEITEKDKKYFDQSASKQDSNTSDVESLVNDMGTFIVRLPNEKYSIVHKEMEEKKVVAGLTELSGFVRANLVLKSVGNARMWGEQLNAWASMLQDEAKSQGEGEGQAEISPEMMELMIAIVRAAQEQDSIREQTQALDAQKWETENYLEDAGKVAELEAKLAASVAELSAKTTIDEAKPLLDKVQELMTDVSLQLGSPKTDAATVADQGIIIELLVPPDKKGGSDSKSPAMAKMQQAAQKMMAKGQKPGQGNQKADSNMQAVNAQGAALRDKANQRLVDKSSGANQSSEWPAEFRDQLQAYFNNLEAPEGK